MRFLLKVGLGLLSCDSKKFRSDFEMFDLTEYPNAQEVRAQGSTIFLPSFVPHQAHPVTKGKRYSLAVWFEGPKWV